MSADKSNKYKSVKFIILILLVAIFSCQTGSKRAGEYKRYIFHDEPDEKTTLAKIKECEGAMEKVYDKIEELRKCKYNRDCVIKGINCTVAYTVSINKDNIDKLEAIRDYYEKNSDGCVEIYCHGLERKYFKPFCNAEGLCDYYIEHDKRKQ